MKVVRWLAGLVALCALLAGCTGTPQPTPSSPTVPSDARTDTNATPRDALLDGGGLRLALTALPTQWNPWHPDAAAPGPLLVLDPLRGQQIRFDAAGNPTPNPDFITSADVRHDERTTVSLTLNPNAVWADGAPITAIDWMAAFAALNGSTPAFRTIDDHGWRQVETVRQGDTGFDVEVVFRGVVPDWSRPLAAGPARAESVSDPATFNEGWTDYRAGWFCGPFVVTHTDVPQGLLTLERNPLWWGETARLERIVFRTIQPEAEAAAFQHNELDRFEVGLSADRAQQARAAGDTTLRTAPGTSGRVLLLNTSGFLADPAVRQVVVRSLDRRAIAQAVVAAIGVEPVAWSNPVFLTNHPGYTDQARSTDVDFDPARAAADLERAGWRLEGGRRVRDGQVLTLTFTLPPEDTLAAREYARVALDLAALGIATSPATGAADLTPTTVTLDAYPLTRAQGVHGGNPDVAEIVARIASETDPIRRADQGTQLGRALWLEATALPLYQVPQAIAVKSTLGNLGAHGFASVIWEDVGWTR